MKTICECGIEFNMHDYYQHIKSVKHLKFYNKYYCKQCNEMCELDRKEEHLNSEEHKNINEKLKDYCDVCE